MKKRQQFQNEATKCATKLICRRVPEEQERKLVAKDSQFYKSKNDSRVESNGWRHTKTLLEGQIANVRDQLSNLQKEISDQQQQIQATQGKIFLRANWNN